MPKKPNIPALEVCRERALMLIAQRPHSEKQLHTKLLRKSFAPGDVKRIIDDFIRTGLLNDRNLAFDYCRSMKDASPPVGRRRVMQKMRQYGLSSELISEALEAVWDAGGETEEMDRGRRAAELKLRLIRGRFDTQKVREKLYRHLAGKGFNGSVCSQIVADLMRNLND